MSAVCERARPFPFAPYVFVTETTTVDELRRYLRDIEACGFDCIRFGGGEGGCGAKYLGEDRYDFAHMDLIFDLVEETRLRIMPNLRVGYADWMAGPPHDVPRATHLIEDEYHRLIAKYAAAAADRYRHRSCLLAYEGVGEPGGFPPELESDPRFCDLFRAWLQKQYGTLENLSRAWGYGGPLLAPLDSWDTWRTMRGMHFEKYRHRRDLTRFKTEFLAERMTRIERVWQQRDPDHPVLTGVHQLLGNVTQQKWDFELQAAGADGFFSSIHGGWHFWILPQEFLLPLYVQARLTRDFAKGKWALPYETTGGPNFRSAIRQHNMHPAEHWQMMMCYLGAGLQGIGLWAWNCRLSGPEAGEYGMTTLQGAPSRRATLLGAFCRRAQQHRAELYDARADACVAVLTSWEAEMFSGEREMGRLDGASGDENSRNRIGVARALMNGNVPFEFVTDNELLAGRVNDYPVLVVPGMPVVRGEVMAALGRYAARGGRVVADAPFATFDEYGRVRTEGAGGAFDRLAGAYPLNHYNAQFEPRSVDGQSVTGQFSEVEPTTGTVTARFDDGRPAAIRNSVGAGQVRYFAYEVASRCFSAGNRAYESVLIAAVLDERPRPPWTCEGAFVFRRRQAGVDHWFAINRDAAHGAALHVADAHYRRVTDVMSGQEIAVGPADTIQMPAGHGCWLRAER
jgi:beta-galactosidase